MADSTLSAGELRKRYHAGGTVPDDQLSASQLRARHGIPGNSSNFSDKPVTGELPLSTVVMAAGAVLLALLVAGGLFAAGVFG